MFGGRFCHKASLEVDLPANLPDGDQPAPVTVASPNGNSQPLFWLHARNASSTKVKCRLRDAASDEDVASFDHAPGCCAGSAFRLYTGGRCQSSSRVGAGKLAILRGEECIKVQLRGLPYVGINVSGDFAERTFSILQHMPGRRSERLLASVAPGPAGVRVRINPGIDVAFAVAVVAFTCVAGFHKNAAGAVGCSRSSSLSGSSVISAISAASSSGRLTPDQGISAPASPLSSSMSPLMLPSSPLTPPQPKQHQQQRHQQQQGQRPRQHQGLLHPSAHAYQQRKQTHPQSELKAQQHAAALEAALESLAFEQQGSVPPSPFCSAPMQLMGSCSSASVLDDVVSPVSATATATPLMLQQLQQRECELQEQLRVLQHLQMQALKEKEMQQQMFQQQMALQHSAALSWSDSQQSVQLHPFLWGPQQRGAANIWA